MNYRHYFSIIAILLTGFSINAQQSPTIVTTADEHIYVSSLASRMNELTPAKIRGEAKDGRSYKWKREVIPGKGRQSDILSKSPNPLEQKIPGKAPDLVFTSAFSDSSPTDPSLALGPNHIFATFNTGFAIYDKNGVTLVGQTAPYPAIFSTEGCCDLTVSYDPIATSATNPTPGRWVLSFLLDNGAQIAVSDGPDPVTAGWNVYTISTIIDYQKLSVWSDGYYVTDQRFSGNRVYAMDRQAMLNGEPAGNVSIQGFNLPDFNNSGFASVQVLNISDDQYPGPGNATVVFLQDDAYNDQDQDAIKFWDLDVDFDTPGNSVISNPQEIPVTPFNSVFDGTDFDNLSQPNNGVDIDALQGTIMNQAQYKKFSGYNACIFNFVIDIGDPTDPNVADEQAAIRWYEFRQTTDGQPWVLENEGTFADPDGRHFWNGSMTMDNLGNIGMGFTAMGNTATLNGTQNEFVSSYYTGRYAADPANTMTITPQLIQQGQANLPNTRYGDYCKIDIDPSDYQTMYFVNELMQPQRSNVVGRFILAPNLNNDVGVVNITAPIDGDLATPQDITVTIRNFGLADASNIDVSYSIDGGTPVTGIFTGTIASSGTASFTFPTQGDFTADGQVYSLTATTNYPGDELSDNDSFTKNVTHIFANDIGVSEITSPTSGEGLGNEDVTITIQNFGTEDQTGFDVSYDVDGNAPVVENVGSLIVPIGGTVSYTFAAQVDLTASDSYLLTAKTELSNDGISANDAISEVIENQSCFLHLEDEPVTIGPDAGTITFSTTVVTQDILISDINVIVNITHPYTSNITLSLFSPDNTEVRLFTRYGGSGDNLVNTIFDDEGNRTLSGESAPFTDRYIPDESLSAFDGTMSAGEWRMRIRDSANENGGTLDDWTLEICGVGEILEIENNAFSDGSDLLLIDRSDDQFQVLLNTTEITNTLLLTVYDMNGQRLMNYPIDNETGTGYEYNLDMSYVASGVYLIRLGDESHGSTKRIIIK